MKKRMLLLVLALLLTALAAGCTQEAHHSEITLPEQEKPPVAEETITEPEAPTYLNLTVQALYEGLLDADCRQSRSPRGWTSIRAIRARWRARPASMP